ncbi:class II aldolase/adducin family protein [Anaerostipes caccae]|uniref:class II aldolase/adducin family protein n=1 Tax=Anaerostipes caccae TaxID=105841 RepID=UPI0022E9620A|nr:class II aldolase/adducin family protein [Anaerostipes caccae]
MEKERAKEQVIQAAIECSDKKLIHGTSGNVSIACREEGVMVITPSGIPYEEITPDMVPVIDLATGEWTEGKCKPSTEAPMHRLIFLNKVKMEAVVHTHSPFATAMSILVEELPAVAAASAPYSPVKVAPFEIPGSQEIAEAAVKAMGDHNVVCLLENHGLIAAGRNVSQAMSIAEYVEENSQIAYYTYVAGKMKPLPESGYNIMHDRAVKKLGLE